MQLWGWELGDLDALRDHVGSADSCTGLTGNCLGQCGLQAWVSAVCRGVKPCPMPSCLAVTPLELRT